MRREHLSRVVLARSAMLGALAVGVVVLAVAAAGGDETIDTSPPITRVATVREFLRNMLVTHDAEGACEFLTPAERARVGGARGCDEAMARLSRGLRPPLFPVYFRANDVVVLGRGGPVTLHLEPVPRSTRAVEVAPASGWRIASGLQGFPR